MTAILAIVGVIAKFFGISRWMAGGIMLALVAFGAYLAVNHVYSSIWQRGYDVADAYWKAIIKKEREDQEKAVREAAEEAWRVIDRLNTELEERNALIEKLNAEGDADPDADSGGITADSVRRINRSRKARPQ